MAAMPPRALFAFAPPFTTKVEAICPSTTNTLVPSAKVAFREAPHVEEPSSVIPFDAVYCTSFTVTGENFLFSVSVEA